MSHSLLNQGFSNFVEILQYWSQKTPQKEAFSFFFDDYKKETIVYGELTKRSKAIAAKLQETVKQNDRALLLFHPGINYIYAFLGCLFANVIAIPTYPPKRQLIDKRLTTIIKDSQANIALTTTSILQNIEHHIKHSPELKKLQWVDITEIDIEMTEHWNDWKIAENDIAFLQYTSGSTDAPRGVMVSHSNLLHNLSLISERFEHNPESHGVIWLPPFHDMGLIGGILQVFYAGFSVTLMSPVFFLQKPFRWLKAISDFRATTSGGPNFAYDLCVDKITDQEKNQLDLSSWSVAFNGAEPILDETLERFTNAFASCGFRKEAFFPCYGLSEATLFVSGGFKKDVYATCRISKQALRNNIVQIVPQTKDKSANDISTIVGSGKLHPDQRVIIVDPENHVRCEEKQIGEIWISGPSVATGYFNNLKQSEKTFHAKLNEADECHFLRTGDLGFIRNNELYVTGRRKDVIIFRGKNYYPQDIEKTVWNSHPALQKRNCAAFSLSMKGRELLVVVQEVRRSFLRDLNSNEAITSIRQAVTTHHEIPVHIVTLVRPGSIPKTSSGKLMRYECKDRFQTGTLKIVATWEDSIENQLPQLSKEVVSKPEFQDKKALEESIIQWLVSHISKKKSLNQNEIDPKQNFMFYGLDSLDAVRISTDLGVWLGKSLSPTLAWDFPSIKEFAKYLAGYTQEPTGLSGDIDQIVSNEPVAVIGMSGRFPEAASVEEYWRLLREGIDAIKTVPRDRWMWEDYYDPEQGKPGKMNTKWGGFIERVDYFDEQFFGISPREAEKMDPQQRLLLEITWEAMENAGYAPENLEGSLSGVFIGISNNDYARLQASFESVDAYSGTGNSICIASNRLSYFFNLRGPSLSVDTACSSSLVAVHLACKSLKNRECHLAIAGGVNLILSPEPTIVFSQAKMMASDGRCKTYDAAADGYVRGEGCSIVVLKRLSDAQRDGDRILAVLKGSAVNQDGRSNGLTAPNMFSQIDVIRKAVLDGGVSLNDISYIETHGTGTALGDQIEIQALTEAFRGASKESIRIGSVKTNIGHLEAAAGVAALIKVILALDNDEIPPHLHFRRINPNIELSQSPLKIATELGPWDRDKNPRLAGVSSFGFGGTNAHVIVEEPPRSNTKTSEREENAANLMCLSAKSKPALHALVRKFLEYSKTRSNVDLADICYTANTGRNHFSHRYAFVASSYTEWRDELARVSQEELGYSYSSRSRIAFLFSGQGSQYSKMGRRLYKTQPVFTDTLDLCNKILLDRHNLPLLELLFDDGKSSAIHETYYAQPVLFALEYSLAQLWSGLGIRPDFVMGHGLGEYVAATVAGAFTLEEGLKLIFERGKLVQALPRDGIMVAIAADQQKIAEIIKAIREDISIAAVNGPKNCTISGQKSCLQEFISVLDNEGIPHQELGISHAFHSNLMDPILSHMKKLVEAVEPRPLRIPLVSNLTGEVIERGSFLEPSHWVKHLRETILFYKGIQNLSQLGCEVFLEIGPKPVLISMARQCLDDQSERHWLPTMKPDKDETKQLLETITALYCRGFNFKWEELYKHHRRRKAPLPTYPFERRRHWTSESVRNGGNYTGAKKIPLLGMRLQTAQPVYQSHIFLDNNAFLRDHTIHSSTILPVAAYVEMALAAAMDLGEMPVLLEQIEFQRALFLSEQKAKNIQFCLSTGQHGSDFSIFSKEIDSSWTLHTRGRIQSSGSGYEPLREEPFDETKKRLKNEINVTEFYNELSKRGLHYGGLFKGIQHLWKSGSEALGFIDTKEKMRIDLEAYQFHPALFDACLQVMAAVIPEEVIERHNEPYLPVSIERVILHRPPSLPLWSYARLRSIDGTLETDIVGDVLIINDLGEEVAEINGIIMRQMSSDRGDKETMYEWLYDVVWLPKSLPYMYMPLTSLHQILGPAAIAKSLEGVINAHVEKEYSSDFNELNNLLDDLIVSYLFPMFQQLGWNPTQGERVSIRALKDRLGIAPQYERLLNRFFDMLIEDALIIREKSEMRIRQSHTEKTTDIINRILRSFSEFQPLVELIDECGRALPQILIGSRDPLEIILPEGSISKLEEVYQKSSYAAMYNRLVVRTVQTILDQIPEDRTIRILEVGAGTGGLTYEILPLLQKHKTEYLFTDLSSLFFTKAKKKFSEFPFIQFKLFDVEKNPQQQGFPPNHFDIIIAANVLHATKNLRETLNNIKRLLTSCGFLILLEGTGPARWMDMIFGLTEGWWRYEDIETRTYPLIPPQMWKELLMETGYQEISCYPLEESGEKKKGLFQQVVIIARCNQVVRIRKRRLPKAEEGIAWIVFSDQQGLASKLRNYLERIKQRCFLIDFGSSYEERENNMLTIRSESTEDMKNLVDRIHSDTNARCRGIVYLSSIDVQATDNIKAQQIEQNEKTILGPVLHLVQNLASRKWLQTPKVWLITRGAVPVCVDGRNLSISQSTLWGFGRALSQEQASFWGGLIDIDPKAKSEDHLYPIVWELMDGDKEDQIAIHGGQRYVARLTRKSIDHSKRIALTFRPNGTYLITGGMGDLGLELAKWLVRQGAQRLILLGRTELPPRQEWDQVEANSKLVHKISQIREIENMGASLHLAFVDVANEGDLHAYLDNYEKEGWPQVIGVVHAAGIARLDTIEKMNLEALSDVLKPKVSGGWALHRYFTKRPLDFFILFSSAASIIGLPRHSHYAAANAFLDGLAHYRKAKNLPALSVNWAFWAQTGMARRYLQEGHVLLQGVGSLSLSQGFGILRMLVEQDQPQVSVMRVNWDKWFSIYPSIGNSIYLSHLLEEHSLSAQKKSDLEIQQDLLLDQLSGASTEVKNSRIMAYVCKEVAMVMRLDNVDLDVNLSLTDLGVDSLMAIELKNRIESKLKIELPIASLLESPTISELINEILARMNAISTEDRFDLARNDYTKRQEDLLSNIDNLSDDEVDLRLKDMLNKEKNK